MAIMILSPAIEAIESVGNQEVQIVAVPLDQQNEMPEGQEEEEVVQDPVAEAFEDLVEKVSVAGWKEAFGEHITWIAHVFKVVLLIFSGICLYYCYRTIIDWRQSGYTDEISDAIAFDGLPFSNVTVCTQVFFNQSSVAEQLQVPKMLLEKYLNVTGEPLEEFYRQMTLLLSISSRLRKASPQQLYFFRKISEQISDYETFIDFASPACRQIFRKCTFNRREFDCCENVVKSFSDDGICYLLAVSIAKL